VSRADTDTVAPWAMAPGAGPREGGASPHPSERQMGMVALARQWLSALWRFLETGVLPKGASLNAAVRIR
jgi:hypothetical protein